MATANHILTYDAAMNQSFVLYTTSGDAVVVALNDLESLMIWGSQTTIISACQVGAAFVALVGLILISKPEKRRQYVYWLNAFALVMVILSQLIKSIYFVDGWFNPYCIMTGDYTHIGAGPKALSILGGLALVLLVVAVLVSLIMQTNAICAALSPKRRRLIVGFGCLLAIVTLALRLAQFVYTTIVSDIDAQSIQLASLWYARDASLATTAVFFSSVFLIKLAKSIRQRRTLGLKGFGPMQVIFIGFSQTMVLPALFALLQFAANPLAIDELVLTSVALSLPLTAVWASSVTQAPATSLIHPSARGVTVVRTVEQDSMSTMSTTKAGTSFSMVPLSQQGSAV